MGAVVPIHGRDHCPGGADEIPCLEQAASQFGSVLFASSGAFTASGAYNIGWTDVDTNDTAAFGMTTTTNPNDTVQCKKKGIYFVFASCGATTAGTDYGLSITGAGLAGLPNMVSGFLAAHIVDYDPGEAMGVMGLLLANVITGTFRLVITEQRVGTVDFDNAGMQVLYIPAATTTLTDIV
jgi:hypothetical protein